MLKQESIDKYCTEKKPRLSRPARGTPPPAAIFDDTLPMMEIMSREFKKRNSEGTGDDS